MVDPISVGSLILGGGSFLSGLFGGRGDKRLARESARSQLALARTLLPAARGRVGVSVRQSNILRQILGDIPATSSIAQMFRRRIEGISDPRGFAESEEGRRIRGITDIPFEEATGRVSNILAAQGATTGGRAIREFESLGRGKAQTESLLLNQASSDIMSQILGLVQGSGGGEAELAGGLFGQVGGRAAEGAAATAQAAGAGVGAGAETFFLNQLLKKRFGGGGAGLTVPTTPSASPLDMGELFNFGL